VNDGIVVKEVVGKHGVRDFLDVPFSIYAGDRNWVAPLYIERMEHLDRNKNPYFAHAEVQLFVAYRNGLPVGRISAQIDRLRLDRFRDATGQFGFIEALDDPVVFTALLQAAENWLKQRGMRRVQGPFSFSINDETGLLIEGFNRPPRMMMGHAKPYYAMRLEALGYVKTKDVIAYDYDARNPMPRSMQAMVDKATASGAMQIRAFDKKQLASELKILIDIFNDAWSENWGFVPMTEAEITALGNNLKMLVKGDYIAIATYKGEPAAMAISLPDINQWIADLHGRLLPFGWAKLAWRLFARPPAAVRIPLMGVRKKYHGTLIGSALAIGVIGRIRAYHLSQGTNLAELSWILEDNTPMRKIIEALGAVAYKTYRIYEKEMV
jgi:GNAT superfamily N-acetyltransferase